MKTRKQKKQELTEGFKYAALEKIWHEYLMAEHNGDETAAIEKLLDLTDAYNEADDKQLPMPDEEVDWDAPSYTDGGHEIAWRCVRVCSGVVDVCCEIDGENVWAYWEPFTHEDGTSSASWVLC